MVFGAASRSTSGGMAPASLTASWLAVCLEVRFHRARAACPATCPFCSVMIHR